MIKRKAFTLIEVLMAVAIMTVFVSVVYSTYFTSTRSAIQCNNKMADLQTVRSVLAKISRQIRCTAALPGGVVLDDNTWLWYGDRSNSFAKKYGQLNRKLDQVILHFVTNSGIYTDPKVPEGPYEVFYKYDEETKTLYYAQIATYLERDTFDSVEHWQPVVENVQDMNVAFYDGKEWLDKWDSVEYSALPVSVKLEMELISQTTGEPMVYQIVSTLDASRLLVNAI